MRRSVTFKAALAASCVDRTVLRHPSPSLTPASVRLVSPAIHGSFGDEAMLLSAIGLLEQQGLYPNVSFPGTADSWPANFSYPVFEFDKGIMLGGFLYKEPYSAIPKNTVLIGADSLDSAYGVRGVSRKISMLNNVVREGGTAVLANFSLREKRHPDADRMLRTLDPRVELWARDKNSASRAAFLFGREVGCVPDVAAHLKPSYGDEEASTSKGRVIALVVNGHLRRLNLRDEQGTLDYFVKLANEIGKRCDRLLIFAHDTRNYPDDPALVDAITSRVAGNTEPCIPKNAAHAKLILSRVDLCVSSRMHAAVASLSEGVPTIGLDYVDKFSGQFEWYEQQDAVVPVNPMSTAVVIDMVDFLLQQLPARRQQLFSAVKRVRDTALPWLTPKD